MKQFTLNDVVNGRIYANQKQLELNKLAWQQRGEQETASGYGRKLTSCYKIHFEGKLRRIYFTCFSNAGSAWFKFQGKKIYVD